MPKTIEVGQTATAVISGFDQFGKPFPLSSSDSISVTASVGADVTFDAPVFNADGTVSVVITGVNPDAGDSISATVDTITTNADVLTINAPAAVLTSATLTLQ